MKLYKYVTAERIGVLKNGLIRFTQPKALNDQADMQPHLQVIFSDETWDKMVVPQFPDPASEAIMKEAAATIWQRARAEGRRLNKRTALLQVREKFKNDPVGAARIKQETIARTRATHKALEQSRIQDFYNRNNARFGVLSLTERSDNTLMWGHYANGHTGFVIEFDPDHQMFKEPESDEYLHGLRQVHYQAQRPSLKDLTAINDWKPLFFTKEDRWSYEEEWRLVAQLADADKVLPDKAGDPELSVHLFKLPPACIKGVILGSKMASDHQKALTEIVRRDPLYSHLTLSESVPVAGSYDMETKLIP